MNKDVTPAKAGVQRHWIPARQTAGRAARRSVWRAASAGMTALIVFLLGIQLQAEPSDDRVWVIVRPVQCMSNPWEKAWMAKNKNQAAKYPRAKEFEFIKQFFAAKKIPILEMRHKPYVKGDPYCQTCECGRGDTLFLLIDGDNVPRMVRLGYTERMAARDVPSK